MGKKNRLITTSGKNFAFYKLGKLTAKQIALNYLPYPCWRQAFVAKIIDPCKHFLKQQLKIYLRVTVVQLNICKNPA